MMNYGYHTKNNAFHLLNDHSQAAFFSDFVFLFSRFQFFLDFEQLLGGRDHRKRGGEECASEPSHYLMSNWIILLPSPRCGHISANVYLDC